MARFYGWGSTVLKLQSHYVETTRSPEVPGTHLIGLGKMTGWVDLGATQRFWTQDPWIGNPAT